MGEIEAFKPNEIKVEETVDDEGRPIIHIDVQTAEGKLNAAFSPWQGVSAVEGVEDPWKEAAKMFKMFVERNLQDKKKIDRAYSVFVEWDKNSKNINDLEELLKPGGLELRDLKNEEEIIDEEIRQLGQKKDALFEQRFPGLGEVKEVLSELSSAFEVSALSGSADELLSVLLSGETETNHFKVVDDPSAPITIEKDGFRNKKGDVITPKRIAEEVYLFDSEGEIRFSSAAVERLGDAIRENQVYFNDYGEPKPFPMQWQELK